MWEDHDGGGELCYLGEFLTDVSGVVAVCGIYVIKEVSGALWRITIARAPC